MPLAVTDLPVGGMGVARRPKAGNPTKGPVLVPRTVTQAATLLPSAKISSIDIRRSGNVVLIALIWPSMPPANGDPATHSSPMRANLPEFMTSSMNLCTKALLSSGDMSIFLRRHARIVRDGMHNR